MPTLDINILLARPNQLRAIPRPYSHFVCLFFVAQFRGAITHAFDDIGDRVGLGPYHPPGIKDTICVGAIALHGRDFAGVDIGDRIFQTVDKDIFDQVFGWDDGTIAVTHVGRPLSRMSCDTSGTDVS